MGIFIMVVSWSIMGFFMMNHLNHLNLLCWRNLRVALMMGDTPCGGSMASNPRKMGSQQQFHGDLCDVYLIAKECITYTGIYSENMIEQSS